MIARKITLILINSLAVQLLGLIALYFVSHYMGPAALGTIAFANAYIMIFLNFFEGGFGAAHIKRVSEGQNFAQCNGTYLAIKIVLTLLGTTIVISSMLIYKFVLNKHFISKEHEIVLYIMLFVTFIESITRFFIVTYRAKKETAKEIIPRFVGKLVTTIGKITVALMGLSVVFLAGATAIGVMITFIICFYLFKNYPIDRFNKELFKSYISFALPIMFVGFLGTFAKNMDKLMLQFLWSTADVGYYSAAQRLLIFLEYLPAATIALLFPTISQYHSKGYIKSIQRISKEAEKYISMIVSPMVMLIIVFAQPICNTILGKDFVNTIPILVILSFVTLINGVSQPYIQQAGATNHIITATKCSIIVFILNILLNLLFIPRKIFNVHLLGMGGIGAAIATLISIIIGITLFRYYAYKFTGSKSDPQILLYFVSASIAGFISYYILQHCTLTTIMKSLVAVMSLVIYLLLIILFKRFTKNDFIFILNAINPIKIKNYILTELKITEPSK